jgi:uncharacterized membrane protein
VEHGRRSAPRWFAAHLPLALTTLVTLAYAASYALQAIQRHEALGSSALDLGYEDQVLWNTLHGHLFQFSLLSGGAFSLDGQAPLARAGGSLLGYHAELLLAPLSLLYAFIPDVRALLALQAVVVCAGAFSAFLLAQRRLASAWAGFLVALAYLSSPFVEAELLSDFHTVALDSALRMLLFVLVERRATLPACIVGVTVAAAQEDASLAVALVGVWALLLCRWRRGGALLLATGVAFLTFDFVWLLPHFSAGGASPFLVRYGYLGATPPAMVGNVLRDPGLLGRTLDTPQAHAYLRALLGSTGGLALLSPATLLIALPSLGINLLSSFDWMRTGMAQYSALVLPVLIVSSIEGVRLIDQTLVRLAGWRRSPRRTSAVVGGQVGRPLENGTGMAPANPQFATALKRVPRQWFTVALTGWLALGALMTHYQLGAGLGGAAAHVDIPDTHAQLLHHFLAEIPPDDAVSTTSSLAPHLTHRPKLYLFPNVLDAQDVLLDLTTSPFPLSWGDQRLRLLDLLQSGAFGVADAADGYVLLQRGAPLRNLPRDTFSFADGPEAPAAHPPLATFGGTLQLLDAAIRPSAVIGAGRQEMLTLDWTVTAPVVANLVLAVWLDGTPRPLPPDFRGETPTLVWRPTSNWQPGQVVRIDLPPLPVRQWGPLQVAWFRQDTPNEAVQWLACVDAAGRPCPLGNHFLVRRVVGMPGPLGALPLLGPWLTRSMTGGR